MTLPLRAAVRLFALAACMVGALAAQAQVPGDFPTGDTVNFTYAEPGAPTFEVIMIGEGLRNGIYRLQEGTTLTELIALSGGAPTSSETERQIVEARIRILRASGAGGDRTVIYEALTEQAIREPQRHPDLQEGDIIESEVTLEETTPPFTFRDGLQIVSSVASLVLLVLRIGAL